MVSDMIIWRKREYDFLTPHVINKVRSLITRKVNTSEKNPRLRYAIHDNIPLQNTPNP
jgi:hypothetical protein